MIKKSVQVTNDTGLHSRPADIFVRTARLYESNIKVSKDGKTVDAKNIVKIILLNAKSGSQVEIEADGNDEIQALEALMNLIESDFKEVDERIEI